MQDHALANDTFFLEWGLLFIFSRKSKYYIIILIEYHLFW